MEKELELIKHAAVKTENGWVIMAKHHGACIQKAHYTGLKVIRTREAQGFVTNRGRFVTRTEAADIATKNGQITKKTNYLVSEDIWREHIYGGKHNYHHVHGYVPRDKTIENE